MIIFLDVDGTLINYSGILPDSARNAIQMARNNEHEVYICTGCSKCEIEVRDWNLALDGMIGGNGCYIESKDEVVFHKTLTFEQCKHFVMWCKERKIGFRLECNQGMYISENYEEASLLARLKYREGKHAKMLKGKHIPMNPCMIVGQNLCRDDVNKTGFVLRSYQDYLDACIEFKDLKVGTWGGLGEGALYGDVGTKGIDKGHAIELLLKHLGVEKEDSIAFGDAKVDIPMFQSCGFSVAMGNAGKETKVAADYICDDVDHDGLYKAFQYLKLI